MLKKIIKITLTSFAFINSLNAETIYSPAVTVTGGGEEADSLSGSGTYIGSDTIKSNNYDNIDQVLKQFQEFIVEKRMVTEVFQILV